MTAAAQIEVVRGHFLTSLSIRHDVLSITHNGADGCICMTSQQVELGRKGHVYEALKMQNRKTPGKCDSRFSRDFKESQLISTH